MIKEFANKVFEAQILSKEQKNAELNRDRIKSVTLQKGGMSILLYRSVFREKITDSEEKLLYYLGGLGQLENDIFDIYKDYQDRIKTLATTEQKISNLRNIYVSLMYKVFDLLQKTSFTKHNKEKFLNYISLISCRTMVSLDLLKKAEKNTNNTFCISEYYRKDLVCDMDKISNQIKLLGYYIKKRIE